MRFKVIQFGMADSGSNYNWMITMLAGAHNLHSYVDDVLQHNKNWPQLTKIVCGLFERAKGAGKPRECKIGYGNVDFCALDGRLFSELV